MYLCFLFNCELKHVAHCCMTLECCDGRCFSFVCEIDSYSVTFLTPSSACHRVRETAAGVVSLLARSGSCKYEREPVHLDSECHRGAGCGSSAAAILHIPPYAGKALFDMTTAYCHVLTPTISFSYSASYVALFLLTQSTISN